MEPNNIEDQFRDKLNEREIKPSENAWDRLDAMLTVAEKPKRSYGWLYIAASFLGFLLIATVFFSQTEEAIDVPIKGIVNENTPSVRHIQESAQPATIEAAVEEIANEDNIVLAEIKQSKKIKPSGRDIKTEALPVVAPKGGENQIAENTIINQKTEQTEINQKPSYIDVDELLASVEKPGKQGKLFMHKSEIKVNPNSLLSQVDGELEPSFSQKVLSKVNKNYKTIRVALSKRNKE